MKEDQKSEGINIKKARRILGKIANEYSDDELKTVIDGFYGIAEAAYYEFLKSQ